MRLYHDQDDENIGPLCDIFCQNELLDLCSVHDISMENIHYLFDYK